jgi:hypothetical protein
VLFCCFVKKNGQFIKCLILLFKSSQGECFAVLLFNILIF